MPANFDYLTHIAKFNRQFESVGEFLMRLENFTAAHEWIQEHNASGKNYRAGHNQFSDWTDAEYKAILGRKGTQIKKEPTIFPETNADSLDWTTKGAVTPVKDQGACGSCWAFSTTGSMEGAHFIATGELVSFSEQQLVDCAGYEEGYGNFGCQGGLQTYAYAYYEDVHNAELESAYPYFSGSTMVKGDCMYDTSSATSLSVQSYISVTPNNVSQMMAALNTQPLAVSIEADQQCFQHYESGVMDNTACGTNLDHAVLAVGYGTDEASGLDYWLIKNSWNTTWGDQGYIKLARVDGAGICGVQMEPLAPTVN